MATRRRIALYFDLAFESDRLLFSRLAPYLRRKRANEIVKSALAAWLEAQKRVDGAGEVDVLIEKASPQASAQASAGSALAQPSTDGGSSGGVRDIIERFAAAQQSDGAEPATAPQVPQVPATTSKPRLGRLM